MTPSGSVTILRNFGAQGVSGLLKGANNTFFGVCTHGTGGNGAVFKITTTGTYNELYNFDSSVHLTGCVGLIDGGDGFYYGIAQSTSSETPGTFFKVSPAGAFTALHMFGSGFTPLSGFVTRSGNGYFYTTLDNSLISISSTGDIADVRTSGSLAAVALLHDQFDNIFMASTLNGVNNKGMIFGASPAAQGFLTHLFGYDGTNGGAVPTGLCMTPAGDLYGITKLGGTAGNGIIFKLTRSQASGPAVSLRISPEIVSANGDVGVGDAGSAAALESGVPFTLLVTALDQNGNVATGYSGVVHFTSDDPFAVLPPDSTLTNGFGRFQGTLWLTGQDTITPTITGTDTVQSTITGHSDFPVVLNPDTISISAPAKVTAGVPFNYIVKAVDRNGSVVQGYSGTIQSSTNAPRATVQSNSTLTSGVGNYQATFTTEGTSAANFKITAVDTHDPNVTATSAAISVGPYVKYFRVDMPSVVQAGIPFNATVTAIGNFGKVITGYNGKVHVTSSDGSAVLPADFTLTNGTATVNVTLKANGPETVTATDTVSPSLTGSASTYDLAAVILRVVAPSSVTAGSAFQFTVTALDRYYNLAPGYSGTVQFWTNAPRATVPGHTTLTNGTGTFNATFTKVAGTSANFKISAGDTSTPSVQGTSAAIAVTP